MDRRNFLRSMLGVAAATALPSEVWPFRKIFLPTAIPISRVDVLDLSYWGIGYMHEMGELSMQWFGLSRSKYHGKLVKNVVADLSKYES